MSIDKEWGGHQELYALSQVLKIDIVVHQVDGPKYIIKYETADTNKKTSGIAHISYHGNCHYNSVRFIDDNDDLPAIDFHSLNNSECNDSVKIIMKAVPWLTKRHAELALEMTNNDVDNSIDFLISDSDTITKLIENENSDNDINNINNDINDINNKNENNNGNDNNNSKSNNNGKSNKNDNNNHVFTKGNSNRKKTLTLSKKELRKMKKKGNNNDNDNDNTKNNNIHVSNNDDNISKSLSEIYL